VLEQVGHAALLAGFVDRTDADGDVGGEGRRLVTLDDEQLEPVGEGVFADFFFQGLSTAFVLGPTRFASCWASMV
jgi:hypothetical protein